MKPKSKKDDYIVKCENREETSSVLNYIDNDNNGCWGHWKYVIHTNKTIDSLDRFTDSISEDFKHLSIISFEIWLSLPDYAPEEVAFKEFVLPEKWCVEITEDNYQILNKYLHNNLHKYPYLSGNSRVLYTKNSDYTYYFYAPCNEKFHSSFDKRDRTEITFDQFKEHVLGEKPEEKKERKIIGYKLVKEEYEQAALKISFNIQTDNFNKFPEGVHFYLNSDVYRKLKDAGVLDLWFEAVYEEESKYQELFNYMSEQHDLTLVESEMENIINIVNRMQK